jgi:hypothetical protein
MGAEQSSTSHADPGTFSAALNTNHNPNTNHNNNNNTNNIPTHPQTKPNKIKRHNHFHSKPSHVIDLIVNQDWQKLLIAISTHQKEIFVAHKVRLFGIDRKVLPLHLACAMSPPPEVIEALLQADKNLCTVKMTMKNYRKKNGKLGSSHHSHTHNHTCGNYDYVSNHANSVSGSGNGGSNCTSSNSVNGTCNSSINGTQTGSTNGNTNVNGNVNGNTNVNVNTNTSTKNHSQSQRSISQRDDKKDDTDSRLDGDEPAVTVLTPTTEPLSSFETSFDSSDLDYDANTHGLEDTHGHGHGQELPPPPKKASNTIFFPDNKQDFALQITPSGDVRQISPNGSYCVSSSTNNNETESPFVYLSQNQQSHTHTHSYPHHEEETNYRNRNHNRNRQKHRQYQSSLVAFADEFLPLHIACLFKASPPVIELLLKAYPQGVQTKNKWGMLPIHIICANISMSSPKIASKKAVDDFTAKRYLNNLYANTMSDKEDTWEIDKVVEILVDFFPQCLNVSSDNVEWLTPIEYVGRNFERGLEREKLLNLLKLKRPVALSVVQGMEDDGTRTGTLNGTRTGTGIKESSGSGGSNTSKDIKIHSENQRPLLYSYLKMKDWESAHLQAYQCPNEASCWIIDKDYGSGSPHLPIHLACSYSAPQNIVHLLIEAYPDGLKAKTKNGFNPLHIACKKSLSHEILLELIETCPDAVSDKDEFGRIPLHLACRNNISLSGVKALIEAYPESCALKDYNGHTAFTYLYANNEDTDSTENEIALLFEKYDGGYSKPEEELTVDQ